MIVNRARLGWLLALALIPALAVGAAGEWQERENVSQSEADTVHGALATDSQGRALYVWSEGGELWYRSQQGWSWSETARLGAGQAPALAADDQGAVHLAYLAPVNRDQAVYYAAWTAGGGWTTPEGIVEHGSTPEAPDIAVSGDGQLAATWSENGEGRTIYLAQSDDGALWTVAPAPVATGSGPVVAYAAQGDLVLAWEEALLEGEPKVIWANIRREDAWLGAEGVSDLLGADSTGPDLARGPEGIYLAWGEAVEGDPAILMSRHDGEGWSAPEVVSDLDPAYQPRLAFDRAGGGHLAFVSYTEVWHRHWDPGDGIWQESELIADQQDALSLAGLCADTDVRAAWLAEADEGNLDLFTSALPLGLGPEGTVFLPLVRIP